MSGADLDRAAEDALSSAIAASGDLMGAFMLLCATATIGDVEGESYGQALERMARSHFGPFCAVVVLCRPCPEEGQ
jgi:hypothetical protein